MLRIVVAKIPQGVGHDPRIQYVCRATPENGPESQKNRLYPAIIEGSQRNGGRNTFFLFRISSKCDRHDRCYRSKRAEYNRRGIGSVVCRTRRLNIFLRACFIRHPNLYLIFRILRVLHFLWRCIKSNDFLFRCASPVWRLLNVKRKRLPVFSISIACD